MIVMPNIQLPNTPNGQANPLNNLAGVTLGDPVSWWPLAWGWWLIIVVVALAIGAMTWVLVRRHQRLKHKKLCLKYLNNISANDVHAHQEAHAILKECTIYYWPKRQVSGLSGDAWYEFLYQQAMTSGLNEPKQTAQSISDVERSVYRPTSNDISDEQQYTQRTQSISVVREWIQKCVPPESYAVTELNHKISNRGAYHV